MKEISSFPQGLGSILLLKDRGQQVSMMEEAIRTVIDVRELFLLNERRVSFFGAQPVGGIGTNSYAAANSLIPTGELWYVWNYTARGIILAGSTLTFGVSFAASSGNFSLGKSSVVPAAAVATTAEAVSDSPFWASPGTRFTFFVDAFTSGGGIPEVNGSVLYTPLKI